MDKRSAIIIAAAAIWLATMLTLLHFGVKWGILIPGARNPVISLWRPSDLTNRAEAVSS
jgi:hypothetical protein